MSHRPLHIAFNATAAITGGGVTYWLNLLPAIARIGAPQEYLVLTGHQGVLDLDLPGNFKVERVRFGAPRALQRLVWEQMTLPALLKRRRVDVLLAPADMAPLFAPCPVVLAIRNLNPYQGPRASTRKARLRERILRAMTRLSASRSAVVFFVSEASRRLIVPSLGLPAARTRVIYHGVGERFRALGRSRDPEAGGPAGGPYILTVSVVRNHKGFETLIRAFAMIRKEIPEGKALRLLVVGAVIDPPYLERLRELIRDLDLGRDVAFLGEIPHAELPPFYRGARLFVLPSLAETFGHPLVEAMASGAPVIATDMDVTREVCEDAASYFKPRDPQDLAARMTEILVDPGQRRRRIEAGLARADAFSWDRCAHDTLALLEQTAEGRLGEAA